MDGDEVEGVKWDAWNRALANIAGIIAVGGRRDDDALVRAYDIAVELRDRLRYSQGRVRSLKQELSVTRAAARSERHEARARLQELETEVARLAGAVQAQGSTLAARETVSQSQAAENDQLRRHIAALERQLQRAEEDRLVTVNERDDALRHMEKMSRLLEESESRVSEVQAEHNSLLGELVATKGRLADLTALETLYGAARDELERLDKENLELKDVVAASGVQLGRSRILDALGIPDSSDTLAGATRSGGGGGSGRRSGRASSPVGGNSRSRSAPRTRRGAPALFAPDVTPAAADALSRSVSRPYSGRASSPPPHGSASAAPSLEDPVSEMAFLGPPSSAYPPDPENYVFYRVGGGYSPKLNPAQPTIPQPRASGWVPKDVVRLVQAFRHSYGLSLEWRFWEPLILMIDEVYRSRADGTLATMKAAQQEKIKAIKRQVRAALGYPSALANGKISHLQRQLNGARKVLALSDRKGEVPLKQMALKDYQLGYQLDRAVEENYALRRSLEDLEELYNAAIVEKADPSTAKTPARGSAAAAAAAAAAGSTIAASSSPPPPPMTMAPLTPGAADAARRSDAFTQLSPRHSASATNISPRRLRQHHAQQQQYLQQREREREREKEREREREREREKERERHYSHHHHQPLAPHHRYSGFGMGDQDVQLPLPRSGGGGGSGREGGRDGAGRGAPSEAAFSRRTSMVSGMMGGGPYTEAPTDVMSLGGFS